MTLREKIADIISGGALAKRDAKIHDLNHMVGTWRLASYESDGRSQAAQRSFRAASAEADRAKTALHAIIARGNTRRPNGTVKAMVKIAEKGLGK